MTPDGVDGMEPGNWVLTRVDNGGPVWQGGSEDARQVRISEGDVARVAQLYPKTDGSGDEAMKLDKCGESRRMWLRLMVRGLETTVEAPRPL